MSRPDLWETPRHRWAVYAAIVAALQSGHPARGRVALALEALVRPSTSQAPARGAADGQP